MEIISRKEAKEKGLTRYFTGIPCAAGHLSERLTSDGHCITCSRINQKKNRSTPEYKAKDRERAKKRWADPVKRAKLSETREKWAKENPEKIAEYAKKSYYKHHEKNLKKIYAAKLERSRNDPLFRLRNNLARKIHHALTDQGTRKDDFTLELVGCNIPELKKHIEGQFTEGMKWDNYTHDGWHLDHIRPCSSFDFSNKEEVYLCFNWRNLQPLWSLENTAKGDKYTKDDEELWIKRMKDYGYEGELFLKYH